MIYTSYYGKINLIKYTPKFENSIFCPISVSIPKYFDLSIFDLQFQNDFKPDWKIVEDIKSEKISQKEYIKLYLEQLIKIDKSKYEKLIQFGTEHDIILLCYERPELFCHRHILSKFINIKFNQNIREI